MNEFSILLLNNFLYGSAFILFLKWKSISNISTLLLLIYLLRSLCSTGYYCAPLYYTSFTSHGTIGVEAVIYLFVINFLLCTSFRNFSFDNKTIITNYSFRTIYKIQSFLFWGFLLVFICGLPDMLRLSSVSNLGSLKETVYEDGNLGGNFFLSTLFSRIFGEASIFLAFVPIFNYVKLKRIKKFDYACIVLYILLSIQTVFFAVSRSIIFIRLVILFFIISIFFNFITRKILIRLILLFLLVLPLFFSLFSAISVSRFGKDKEAQAFATIRYAGEAQLNFIGLMYGNTKGETYGYRLLPIPRRCLGLPYYGDSGTDKETYKNYLDRYNPNPNNVYYQYAGELYLSFGFYGALLFCILLNIYFSRYFITSKSISYIKLVSCAYFASIAAVGIFYPANASEAGNMIIILLICTGRYLKRYK